jgi:hypothetical protein
MELDEMNWTPVEKAMPQGGRMCISDAVLVTVWMPLPAPYKPNAEAESSAGSDDSQQRVVGGKVAR